MACTCASAICALQRYFESGYWISMLLMPFRRIIGRSTDFRKGALRVLRNILSSNFTQVQWSSCRDLMGRQAEIMRAPLIALHPAGDKSSILKYLVPLFDPSNPSYTVEQDQMKRSCKKVKTPRPLLGLGQLIALPLLTSQPRTPVVR